MGRNRRLKGGFSPATSALIDALEPRQLLNAATLKHGLLTVYGSEADDTIVIEDTNFAAERSLTVFIDGTNFVFRSTGVTRMRVFGFGGNDRIAVDDAFMPNLTDVAIDAGDGDDSVTDASLGHKWNRGESVSVLGGAGADLLFGGAHTLSLTGAAGNDSLFGGAAGCVLDGSDGNDLVSATDLMPGGGVRAGGLENVLTGAADAHDALGSVNLIGGAGDDAILGNRLRAANASDTLSGGDGNDAFYPFSTDQIADDGIGTDSTLTGNQFTPPADVTQTATLQLLVNSAGGSVTESPAADLGNNGPNNRIAVTGTNGTVTMQGPAGSTFLLGDLLNAAGYPVDAIGLPPSNVTLTVNGFPSSLAGNQIAGYQINNGDVIQLNLDASQPT